MRGKAGRFCGRLLIEYLIVAGGGGGGENGDEFAFGGHGGAGGVLDGAVSLPSGQGVTVTVGTGGLEGLGSGTADNGNDSVLHSITAVGGGGGGVGGSGGNNGGNGGNGGSGGGAGKGDDPGVDGTPGTGVAGQGTNGSGTSGGSRYLLSEITGVPYFYGDAGVNDEAYIPRDNYGDGGRAGFADAGKIVVSGAGTSAANGTYAPDGELNGQTRYRLGSTTYYVLWIGTDVGNWVVASDSSGNTTLYTGSSNILSPAGGTTVNVGDEPAATISIGEVAPTAGGSGVVIIAYPDSLPALTIGGGLTYDEPSRSGYRVYRFTAGSGTVTFA
jgi:hypothetical protein